MPGPCSTCRPGWRIGAISEQPPQDSDREAAPDPGPTRRPGSRPAPGDALAPFSLVCKAVSANGRPTVKLSDNPAKAVGPAAEVEHYKRVFEVGAQVAEPVLV